MDIGGSPTSTTTTSSSHHPNNRNHTHTTSSPTSSSDPMHSWWESISKARSRIHLLHEILLPVSDSQNHNSDAVSDLSSLADTDRPARSLLLSPAAYSSVSAAITHPSSGHRHDPLCQWLYDTYLSSDADLRLVVLSYLPLISSVYLHRIHYPSSPDNPISLAGFEAVLLAFYSSETKSRKGKPVTVTIPDLSQPSLYHSPQSQVVKSSNRGNLKSNKPLVGVMCSPLEPQIAVKSTKRACIVGVALDCYYKQISHMPSWSKLDFCSSVAVWAGQDCPCASDFDRNDGSFGENGGVHENGNGNEIVVVGVEDENVAVEGVRDLVIGGEEDGGEEKDARIPLPWELLQPVLRILGHCLLGPLNVDEVRDAASVAVRRLYARASHDLVPQAILATKSLIQLDRRAHEAAKAAAARVSVSASGSSANTPSKAKKPEMLLVSK